MDVGLQAHRWRAPLLLVFPELRGNSVAVPTFELTTVDPGMPSDLGLFGLLFGYLIIN